MVEVDFGFPSEVEIQGIGIQGETFLGWSDMERRATTALGEMYLK